MAGALPNGHSTEAPPAQELPGLGALGMLRRRTLRPPPASEDALRHLLLTVDVERLYK